MPKQQISPRTLVGPVPPALISCGRGGAEKNIITLAWVGVVNSAPPMVSIAVRPSRYSYALIRESGEFVLNLPSSDQVEAVDRCGTVSGRNTDKFALCKLTAEPGTLPNAPQIAECPVSLDCRVVHTLTLGTHVLFIGQVEACHVAPHLLAKNGEVDLDQARLLGFCSGRYLEASSLGLSLGYTRR